MKTDTVPTDKMKPLSSTGVAIKSQQTRSHITRIVASSVVSTIFTVLGFYLVLKGAAGEFKFKGADMFLQSLAPGLFFVIASVVIMLAALGYKPYFRTENSSEGSPGFTESKG